MSRLWAAGIDVALVLLFAALGRRSHDEGLRVAGVLDTAWPFLAGVAVGWLLLVVTRRDPVSWAAGLVVWPCTLVLGMLLRVVTDAGTAAPFVVVATVVTGILLVGWRVLVALARSVQARSRS